MSKGKRAGDNWILTYYQQMKDGSVAVSRWVDLVYEYLVKGLQEKQFFFDAKKANAAIDWIEAHCFHTEGPLAPGNIKLELWQKAMLSAMYGIVDENGIRVFREVVLVVGRKNGKTKIASSVANYTFQVEGGYGARVFCTAPKFDQADLVYNDIWTMVTLDPDWQAIRERMKERNAHNMKIHDDSMMARHRQSDLAILATNSTVKKIAFNSKTNDGFNPSLAICDEVASWGGEKGLKQYEVIKSGMGARPEPIMLSCTTSGYENDGIYDELIKRSTRFLLGESKEKRLLPFLYMIDDIEKWNDINELRKSNPNLGVSISVDYLLEEIAVAEGSLSKRSEFICKYCCMKQNSSSAWLSAEAVTGICGKPLNIEDFRSSYCVAGIDLSQTTDLTCALVVIEKKGELYVFAKFFLPSERIDEATARDGLPYNAYIQRGLLQASGDNYIDYHDCYNWIVNLVEEYEILPLMVGYDRYSSQYLCGTNGELATYGFRLDDVFQGDNLYPVIQETWAWIQDKKIHIGDNDLLKVHLLNAAIKMNIERGRGKLVKLSSKDHVDGTAALLDAMCVRQKWWPEIGDRLQNEV